MYSFPVTLFHTYLKYGNLTKKIVQTSDFLHLRSYLITYLTTQQLHDFYQPHTRIHTRKSSTAPIIPSVLYLSHSYISLFTIILLHLRYRSKIHQNSIITVVRQQPFTTQIFYMLLLFIAQYLCIVMFTFYVLHFTY